MARSYVENARKLKEQIDTNQTTVDIVNEAGGIRKSAPEQSDKLGYDWRRTYVGEILVYTEYVEQENPAGTDDNPIAWAEGMVLITNAFYTHDGVRKVWTGENGVIADWNDPAWEEF